MSEYPCACGRTLLSAGERGGFCSYCRPAQPAGFHEITVVVSDQEFDQLRSERALTAPGTISAAFRRRAGLREEPWGIQVARRRELDEAIGGDQ